MNNYLWIWTHVQCIWCLAIYWNALYFWLITYSLLTHILELVSLQTIGRYWEVFIHKEAIVIYVLEMPKMTTFHMITILHCNIRHCYFHRMCPGEVLVVKTGASLWRRMNAWDKCFHYVVGLIIPAWWPGNCMSHLEYYPGARQGFSGWTIGMCIIFKPCIVLGTFFQLWK